MKQKLFALGDDFTIQDASGKDAFFVDGRAFSLGAKLSFQDMQHNELAFIQQKLLAWGPTYELYHQGELMAVVKKQLFTLFHCAFTITEPSAADLHAEGNLTDHEYTFTRDGATIGQVSKQWFTWTDSYGVDIADPADAVLLLASTVVIDMACHGDGQRR
jgi:uncharacterized protein YxjI